MLEINVRTYAGVRRMLNMVLMCIVRSRFKIFFFYIFNFHLINEWDELFCGFLIFSIFIIKLAN